MLEKDLLGNKSGAGFYKRDRRDGKTVFDVLDLETFEHHPAENPEIPIAKEAQQQGDLASRLQFLIQKADEDKHARYIRDTLYPYLAYASRRVPEISDTLEDVDHAMEWGYAYQTGPFRTWDLLGVRETVENMRSRDIEVGGWVEEMLDAGNETFYKTENGTELQFSPVSKEYEPVREDPMYVSLDRLREEGKELASNDSASLLHLGDGVLCLEFHSKGNSIEAGTVEMGHRALEALEREDVIGLVIGNEGRNFSVGANLGEMAHAVQNGDLEGIGESVEALQNLLMAFRFAPKPIVSAPRGQTLGGGLEVCLHSDRNVAAGETYMGLVEVGVGLIPAGGGTKEMARLTADDRIVMNADHLISAAKREVQDLSDGYAPPEHGNNVYASGRTARAALEMGVKTMQWGHYATDYDGVIAGHVARILTGDNLSLPQWVPEEYLLKLEKQSFLDLLKQEKTHERIEALLKTGKPVRN